MFFLQVNEPSTISVREIERLQKRQRKALAGEKFGSDHLSTVAFLKGVFVCASAGFGSLSSGAVGAGVDVAVGGVTLAGGKLPLPEGATLLLGGPPLAGTNVGGARAAAPGGVKPGGGPP